MKRNALFGLLAVLLVFGLIGCATGNVAFTPTELFNDPGFILTGDSVGHFTIEGPGYGITWKYLFTSGEGDTDNNLFEIKNGNVLTAKRGLGARDYSIRVKALGETQDNSSYGIQNIFTFTVTQEPPPPEPIDFPQSFQGSWIRRGDPLSITEFYDKTLVIAGHNIKIDLGRDFAVKAEYVLMAISEDTHTLVNTSEDADGYSSEITANIKLVDGNIVLGGASYYPGFWSGTFVKQ